MRKNFVHSMNNFLRNYNLDAFLSEKPLKSNCSTNHETSALGTILNFSPAVSTSKMSFLTLENLYLVRKFHKANRTLRNISDDYVNIHFSEKNIDKFSTKNFLSKTQIMNINEQIRDSENLQDNVFIASFQ